MSLYVGHQLHRELVAHLDGVEPGGAPVAALAVRDPVDQGFGLVGPATRLLYSREITGKTFSLVHVAF